MKKPKAPTPKHDQYKDWPYLVSEFENFYRSSPNGLCLLDHDLRFVRLNKRLAEINGKSVKTHIGQKIKEIIPEMASDLEGICRKVIKNGKPLLERDLDRIRKDQGASVQKLRV